MSDLESDYMDYESTKDEEGGLHPGRSDPPRNLVLMVAILIGLLALSGIAVALILR